MITVLIGKLIILISRLLKLGNGSTWPGHIALFVNPNFIIQILRKSNTKIILIGGTNGKTTTAKLIQVILEKNGKKVFRNESGANLLNGIASTLIQYSNLVGKADCDYAIFEVDENTLPLAIENINPNIIILLNLFRDQLDRYGEIDSIVKRWKKPLDKLGSKTILILNADDPQVAYLGKDSKAKVLYFSLENKKKHSFLQHAADSTYCPSCNSKLSFGSINFSHLGVWKCTNCGQKRPTPDLSKTTFYPLLGTYNKYNALAAILCVKTLGVKTGIIDRALREFKPAFGRQEILKIDNKYVQVFLSKNPTSFNESLKTIKELGAPVGNANASVAGGKNILIVLNNRIPDGRDVSWIWDTDLEEMDDNMNITISGDRAYDMGLRLKYEEKDQGSRPKDDQPLAEKFKIIENLREAIKESLSGTDENGTLYILPTYSAMLEVRKILTGKKIL